MKTKISKKVSNCVLASALTTTALISTLPVYASTKDVSETEEISPRASQVTHFSGTLEPNQTKTKVFSTNAPLPVKIGYSSSPLYNDGPGQVTIYIDGTKVVTTPGNLISGSILWSLTAGSHTLKVVNGSVASAFGVDIVTTY